jgi:hypothetical protein
MVTWQRHLRRHPACRCIPIHFPLAFAFTSRPNVDEESTTRLVPGNQPTFLTDGLRSITYAMAGVSGHYLGVLRDGAIGSTVVSMELVETSGDVDNNGTSSSPAPGSQGCSSACIRRASPSSLSYLSADLCITRWYGRKTPDQPLYEYVAIL